MAIWCHIDKKRLFRRNFELAWIYSMFTKKRCDVPPSHRSCSSSLLEPSQRGVQCSLLNSHAANCSWMLRIHAKESLIIWSRSYGLCSLSVKLPQQAQTAFPEWETGNKMIAMIQGFALEIFRIHDKLRQEDSTNQNQDTGACGGRGGSDRSP
jgi:hypothetical protein